MRLVSEVVGVLAAPKMGLLVNQDIHTNRSGEAFRDPDDRASPDWHHLRIAPDMMLAIGMVRGQKLSVHRIAGLVFDDVGRKRPEPAVQWRHRVGETEAACPRPFDDACEGWRDQYKGRHQSDKGEMQKGIEHW